MRSKQLRRLLCAVITTAVLAVFAMPCHAENTERVQDLIDDILEYQLANSGSASIQEWIDGELTENAGVSSEWYILGLQQSGQVYDMTAYASALLSYLSENDTAGASTQLKYAFVLAAIGSTDPYISDTMDDAIGMQGIMSWVYGLHLLNNGYESSNIDVSSAVDTVLSLQLADGGWALYGDVSDVDVTANVLQALAPHAASYVTEVERAVTLLSERQSENGDFSSYGVYNPESTAQVVIALASLGIDPLADERFVKNGNTLLDGMLRYQLSDGTYSHTLDGAFNAMATVQVYHALTACQRQQNGSGSLFRLEQSDATLQSPSQGETELETVMSPVQGKNAPTPYKFWICIGIGCVGGIVCLILFLRHKRHPMNYLAVVIAAGAAIVLVCVTDIRTPEEYYGSDAEFSGDAIGSVTMTIRCDTVAGEAEHIPASGEILAVTEFPIAEGDTAFDVLTRAAQQYSIQLEYDGTTELAYVRGIANLYEFDHGDLSGWVYRVNEAVPSVGCSEYVLTDGDVIEWHYSCALGEDIQ